MLKIKINEFSKSILLLGLFLSILLFSFAFASTLYLETGKTTMATVNMFANTALRSLTMAVMCAVVAEWIIGSKN